MLLRHLLAALLAVLILLPATAPANPLEAGAPSAFIEQLGNDAVGMVADGGLSQDAKTAEFRKLLTRGFALQAIARFALGRYWKTATPEQKDRYVALFEDYIVATYSARFSEYEGETFRVVAELPDGPSGVLVETSILRPGGGDPIDVLWRIRSHRQQLKIVDVIIEGVSMSMTQRSDFASAIRKSGGDLDAFMDSLEQKTQAF